MTIRRWKITRDSIRPIVRDVRIGHHRPDLQHYRRSSQPDRLSGDISLDGDGERDAPGSQRSSPASRRVSCISGRLEFWSTVAVATIGSMVGTMVDYGIGYYLGRPAVLRYGRIVRFSEKRLETTEKWFAAHGKSVVLVARFVPLLRTLIAFPAGIVRMDVKRFLAYSAIGILVWDIALVYLGDLAGQNSTAIANTLQAYFLPLGVAALVIAGILVYRELRTPQA